MSDFSIITPSSKLFPLLAYRSCKNNFLFTRKILNLKRVQNTKLAGIQGRYLKYAYPKGVSLLFKCNFAFDKTTTITSFSVSDS